MESYAFAAALGALAPSVVLLQLSEKSFSRALPAQCNQVLDANFFLTQEIIYPYLDCMGTVGRAMYLEFYIFDLVLFPIIYSTALYCALLRLWPAVSASRFIPVLAGIVDVAENVCMCFLLTTFPAQYTPVEIGVSFLTRTKWLLVFVSNVFLVGGLVRKAVAGRANNSAAAKQGKTQ